ncbi:hypothetical protein DFH09DRAFT_1315080 [Mycena vulgaris]|nr:hypothetical protein DFH09DRAFT_1315080 [Mycena vulgaris]
MPFKPLVVLDPVKLERASNVICRLFAVPSLRLYQTEVGRNVLKGISTLLDIQIGLKLTRAEHSSATVPTGGGKTLAFWFTLFYCWEPVNIDKACQKILLVVGPLTALMQSQANDLTAKGMPAVAITSASENPDQLLKDIGDNKCQSLRPKQLAMAVFQVLVDGVQRASGKRINSPWSQLINIFFKSSIASSEGMLIIQVPWKVLEKFQWLYPALLEFERGAKAYASDVQSIKHLSALMQRASRVPESYGICTATVSSTMPSPSAVEAQPSAHELVALSLRLRLFIWVLKSNGGCAHRLASRLRRFNAPSTPRAEGLFKQFNEEALEVPALFVSRIFPLRACPRLRLDDKRWFEAPRRDDPDPSLLEELELSFELELDSSEGTEGGGLALAKPAGVPRTDFSKKFPAANLPGVTPRVSDVSRLFAVEARNGFILCFLALCLS